MRSYFPSFRLTFTPLNILGAALVLLLAAMTFIVMALHIAVSPPWIVGLACLGMIIVLALSHPRVRFAFASLSIIAGLGAVSIVQVQTLLLFASVGVATVALQGCTAAQIQAVSAQAESDVNLIATAIQKQLPTVAGIAGISSTVVTQVTTLAGQINTAAGQVLSAASQAAAQVPVQQIETDVGALLTALGGITLPASVETVLTAAKTLLPVVEAAVGLATALAAPVNGMTADQARAALAAA